jgi:hypothetical protein
MNIIALLLVSAFAQTNCPVKITEAPAKYFIFASDSAGHGLNSAKIKSLVAKYGQNVVIGGDTGDDAFPHLMAVAKSAGVRRHFYVEGPKGPTGDRFSPDEWRRLVAAAAALGIDANTKAGMRQWNTWGWKKHTRNEILGYAQQGYDSVEIDNMDRAIGIGDSPSGMVAFLEEQQAWMAQNHVATKLLLKNQSEDMLTAIVAAVKAGKVDRNMLADFHISEQDTGNRAAQAKLSREIGIQTLNSNNTYDYDAQGVYGIKECAGN